MKDIFAAMAKDGSIARMTITDDDKPVASIDVTAGQLTDLISSMAQIRAAMEEKFEMPDPGGIVFRDVTRSPRYIVGRQHVTSREAYVAFLHNGYGWLCFTLEEEPGAKMVLMLSETIAGMRPRIVKPDKKIIT